MDNGKEDGERGNGRQHEKRMVPKKVLSRNETDTEKKPEGVKKSDNMVGKEVLNKFWLLNIEGLITEKHKQGKINLIKETLEVEKPLVLALTETWLHDHREAEINVENYNVFRKDRPVRKKGRKERQLKTGRGRHVGGVLLYVKSSWLPDGKEILKYSNAVVDVIAIHSKKENMIMALVYRQPIRSQCNNRDYISTHEDFVEPLRLLEEAITKHKNSDTEVMLMGDFNMPSADWDMGSHKVGASNDQVKLVANTQELCDRFLLQQAITTATHRRGNTLDLVFTNYPEQVHSQVAKETVLSSHHLVEFHTIKSGKIIEEAENIKDRNPEYGFHELNFHDKGIDWEGLGKACKTDWNKMLRGKPEREGKSAFHDHCLEKAYEFVPRKLRPRTNGKKRIPRDRRILMRRRTKVYKQISKNPCNEKLKEKIVEIEKLLLASHRIEKKSTEERVVMACKKNSKYFFSYAKKQSKIKQNIGPIIDQNGDVKLDPKDMAEIINDKYEISWNTPKKHSLMQPRHATEES